MWSYSTPPTAALTGRLYAYDVDAAEGTAYHERFLAFLTEESCGKCLFCREGLQQLLALYDDLLAGRAEPSHLSRIEALARADWRPCRRWRRWAAAARLRARHREVVSPIWGPATDSPSDGLLHDEEEDQDKPTGAVMNPSLLNPTSPNLVSAIMEDRIREAAEARQAAAVAVGDVDTPHRFRRFLMAPATRRSSQTRSVAASSPSS